MIMFNNTLVCPAATGFLSSSSFAQSFTCSFCSPFSAKGETTRLTGRLQTLDCAEGRRIEKVPTTRSKNSRERNWLWQQHHKRHRLLSTYYSLSLFISIMLQVICSSPPTRPPTRPPTLTTSPPLDCAAINKESNGN